MKNLILFIILLNGLLTGCEYSTYQGNEMPKSETAVNNLLKQISISIKKKYGIKAIATNVAMPGGNIQLLGLDFQMIGPLPKEEIRKTLIQLAQEFLVCMNSNEAIKPYLETYPCGIKNIEITLFFVDSQGKDLDDPYIGIAAISRGKLNFKTIGEKDNIPSVKQRFEETYEEAVQALETSSK
ncbi:MAG: hypothetical protein JWQ09_4348 [Segetibacter sp.]|nr:hypothetical protein [Segetibacter sp.]